MTAKACIEDLLHIIDEQVQTINEINNKIVFLESEITHLNKSNDDAGQFL